ncbi:hypothetical protein BMS3Bbin01_02254 [bacterium BMS3Bbin01]|nr:hypothetical protein BMS3Bbin01_02254 [bacterium BMS3Bbin01]
MAEAAACRIGNVTDNKAAIGQIHHGLHDWGARQRLHGYLNDIPPAKCEDTYYAQHADKQLVENE